jgi:hypothetical protein
MCALVLNCSFVCWKLHGVRGHCFHRHLCVVRQFTILCCIQVTHILPLYLILVGIALGYGLDNRGSGFPITAGAGNFPLSHRVQNGSGAHPASYPMGTRGSFPGGKAAGSWSWHLHLLSRSRNEWSYTSTSQYAFMALCLVKHRDNFTFYLYLYN